MIKEIPSDMDGFRNGDPKAFQEVMDMYLPKLIYFGNRLIENEEEAKDIVMETFNKLLELRRDFKTQSNIKAFLYITTRNGCYNYLFRVNKLMKDNKALYYLYGDQVDDDGELARINAELIDKLMEAIPNLPPKRKLVIDLFLAGHSNKAIAEKLGTRSQNVSSHIHNAIQQLRKLLICTVFYIAAQFG